VSTIGLPLHGDGNHAPPHAEPPHIAARRELNPADMVLERGAGRGLVMLLLLAGLACLAGTVLGTLGLVANKEHAAAHALGAYHMGFIYCLGLALGCLGLTMIFQQMNAGWAAPVRRQAENVASCIWFVGLLLVPVIVLEVFVFRDHPKLFHWLAPALRTVGGPEFDPILHKKAAYLNAPFWIIRAILFFGAWTFLARRLAGLSLLQDQTGDKWLTARARKVSSYGLLLFALTCAFGAFDWIMSLDFHWSSTMFGVWMFAASVRACLALVIVVLCVLKIRGKLGKACTIEHLHDAGKLLFAFTVFWAYISFSQYFLMWYGNIPEETAFYNLRVRQDWQPFPAVMIIFNFVVPFLLLLFRDLKRNPVTLLPIALWVLVAFALDVYFHVRPVLEGIRVGEDLWLDVLGLLGPVFLFLAVVVRRIAANPLVPLKDPRLHEVLAHKNYV
jgi:hypothetical protein